MRSIAVPIVVFIIVALADLYFFQAVKTIIRDFSPQKQTVIKYIYWTISAFTILTFLLMMLIPALRMNRYFTSYVSSLAVILSVVKVLGIVFLLVEDISRLVRYFIEWIKRKNLPRVS